MSKALKIIDAVIIAAFIAIGAALLIPQQFMGMQITVVQQNMAGNVDVGSAIYSRREPSTSIQTGDRMLDLDTDSVNIYTVEKFDPDTMTVTVSGGVQDTYNVSENFLKVSRVVPFIGYLQIATQSTDGLIILVLILAFVIVVFIASEMIRKNDEADRDTDEDDEDDDDFYTRLAEKRERERSEREAAYAKGKTPKNSVRRRDEDSSDDDGANGMTEISRSYGKGNAGTSRNERRPAREEDTEVGSDTLPDVQAALEAALENQPLNHTGNTATIQQTARQDTDQTGRPDDNTPLSNAKGEIELAMPVRTADELLQKAYAKGLDPNVTEDDTTGVTLVDYSDCL